MAKNGVTDEEARAARAALLTAGGNKAKAAELLGIPRSTLRGHLEHATPDHPIEYPELPDEHRSIDELLRARALEFTRRERASSARLLIPLTVKMDGPIGIVHTGDPHLDDPGTDILAIQRHVEIIKRTPGLFGANVGDLHNNWVGRLARLYAEQETTKRDAWTLVEWFVNEVPWLYLVLGNHDMWSGADSPLPWMKRDRRGVLEAWGARLALRFPNGKEVRINARHDFHGHSQWNPAHGIGKAIQMGWRDHILTCGHKHVSGIMMLKCPATSLISTALRVATYKVIDKFAAELGLPNQNISPAVTTIIDPEYADDDPRLVHTIWDVEEAAAWLKWRRNRKTPPKMGSSPPEG